MITLTSKEKVKTISSDITPILDQKLIYFDRLSKSEKEKYINFYYVTLLNRFERYKKLNWNSAYLYFLRVEIFYFGYILLVLVASLTGSYNLVEDIRIEVCKSLTKNGELLDSFNSLKSPQNKYFEKYVLNFNIPSLNDTSN